jgi:hypothetical protein
MNVHPTVCLTASGNFFLTSLEKVGGFVPRSCHMQLMSDEYPRVLKLQSSLDKREKAYKREVFCAF